MSELSPAAILLKNMHVYEAVRAVPKEAQKIIGGGRLKGMTDINPMWRIKTLTELFGPCGIGWRTDNVHYWTQPCEGTGELAVFCSLELSYFDQSFENWSDPVYGVGGAMLIVKEKDGIRLDDEAYKKAYTDAQSVACKALGIGADVYWSADNTKYTNAVPAAANDNPPAAAKAPAKKAVAATEICEVCKKPITDTNAVQGGVTVTYKAETVIQKSKERFGKCYCFNCMKKLCESQKKVG